MSCTYQVPTFHGAVASSLMPGAEGDVFTRLLRERVVFLSGEVNDETADELNAKLLLLDAEDPNRDISMYINSPGGSVYAGMAIYDTMQFVNADVATTCIGIACSMGQFLLTAGTPGKRAALPHSRILMHQPLGQMQGSASDIAIHAEQMMRSKKLMAKLLSEHTGQTVERIEADSDRDRWFTPDEALAYGMIDRIVTKKDLSAEGTR